MMGLKLIKGDKIDPTIWAVLYKDVSVFESHDKKQSLKAEQLKMKILKVTDFDIDTDEMDYIINQIIHN